MYIPRINEENDLNTLHNFMDSYNFAILINQQEKQLDATHLPVILDRSRGQYGILLAHLARANKQWKTFDQDEVLLIFNGPHAYISPTWYENHPSVPTWNYATVHAYGIPHIIEDHAEIDSSLKQLVTRHEQGRNPEWIMDLPDHYFDTMRKAIVAIEIEITRIEGKFKLSQNKSEDDIKNIIHELSQSNYPEDVATAKFMHLNHYRS